MPRRTVRQIADEHRATQMSAIKDARKMGEKKEVIKRMLVRAKETQRKLDKAAKEA